MLIFQMETVANGYQNENKMEAETLILRMGTIARQVCRNAGGDAFLHQLDAEPILTALRNYFQPAAPDHICEQVTKFLRPSERAKQWSVTLLNSTSCAARRRRES